MELEKECVGAHEHCDTELKPCPLCEVKDNFKNGFATGLSEGLKIASKIAKMRELALENENWDYVKGWDNCSYAIHHLIEAELKDIDNYEWGDK